MIPAWTAGVLALLGLRQDLLSDATQLRDQGRWSEAMDRLAGAARQGPLAPACRALWAEMLLRQQDGEAAASVAADGLRDSPGSAYMTLCLGDAHWLLRELDSARLCYEELARRGADYADAARKRLTDLREDLALGERARALEVRSLWVALTSLVGVMVLAAVGVWARRASFGSSSRHQ